MSGLLSHFFANNFAIGKLVQGLLVSGLLSYFSANDFAIGKLVKGLLVSGLLSYLFRTRLYSSTLPTYLHMRELSKHLIWISIPDKVVIWMDTVEHVCARIHYFMENIILNREISPF